MYEVQGMPGSEGKSSLHKFMSEERGQNSLVNTAHL